jgi:regulatory protein
VAPLPLRLPKPQALSRKPQALSMKSRALSLKARALQWLAQREQSRVELRRKLLRLARDDAERSEAELPNNEPAPEAPEARADAVLDWLEAQRYLSPQRFIEARIHARAGRFGNLRIQQELQQHQLAMSPQDAHALRDSEALRARTVCERKFRSPPANLAERARQARFLAGRGFSPEAIRKALGYAPDDTD